LKQQELNQLELFLQQADAIMEPDILSVLRKYVSDGGNPATVVEMLSDSYHGTFHLSSPAHQLLHHQSADLYLKHCK
jgi:TH1 protein